MEAEADPVRRRLVGAERVEIGRKPGWTGRLDDVPVVLLAAGMGKVNAAQGTTALLERGGVRGVLGFGVAGAYPGSGLETGEVALATRAVYGDEGVQTPAGWISTEGIGIPLHRAGGVSVFNELELDPERVAAAARALPGARVGPFVTVSCCSGTLRRGEELAARHGALCETMEGAACAHVAAIYGVPYLEVRGVSNLVEDRDLSRWRLAGATEAAASAVAVLVRAWPS